MKETFPAEVDALFPKLVEIRRDIHQHPELSNREERTSRLVAAHLNQLGLEVQTGVAKFGVVGLLRGKKTGPVVAVRVDMDALPITEIRDVPYKSKHPGVMHACGHDVHTTIGLGTAELLSRHRDDLCGTVKFLFQPAEEGPPPGEKGGAPLMIEEGVLENPAPEAIFGLHVLPTLEVGTVGYVESSMMAGSDFFHITIRGKKVHGAYPHRGVDAVLVASTAVVTLQTICSRRINSQEPIVLTVGSFHGGNRSNIIADEVVLEGTVRALNEHVLAEVETMMHQILRGVTESFGASYEMRYEKQVPVLVNHTQLVRKMLPTLEQTVGAANVVHTPPRLGAEDFACFAARIPALFYSLGIANVEKGITAMIHTPEFDVDEKCLAIGVKTMAALVVDYLNHT